MSLCPLQWMRARWTSDPCYAFFGVDGTECSFLIYLSEVEWFCPPLPWRNRTVAVPSPPPPPRTQVRWAQPGSYWARGFWGGISRNKHSVSAGTRCLRWVFTESQGVWGWKGSLWAGNLAVEQVVPSPAQPGLECFRGMEHPPPLFAVFYHPHHEKFPLYIKSESALSV